MRYLLDTSVLTRLGVTDVRAAVADLAAGGASLSRSVMTDLELGFSARNAAEWDRIRAASEVFPLVEVTIEDFRRAGHVQRALAAAGLRGRKVPDLLIAAAAERLSLTVLHFDRDFEHIAGLTGQDHRSILRPGTID